MKKFFIALAVVAVYGVVAWNQGFWPFTATGLTTYTNTTVGYSFQYPAGWKVQEPSVIDASMTVVVSPPQGEVSPGEYFSVSVDERSVVEEIASYRGVPITTKQVVIAGVTGTEITVSGTGNVTIVIPHAGLPGNNKTLWLNSLRTNVAEVQQIIQSFRFTK